MKFFFNLITCTVLGLLISNSLISQEETIIRDLIIPATNEHDTIRFGLLVPPSFENEDKKYPVIYFLHGLKGHYKGWHSRQVAEFFKINSRDKIIRECIVVFPDGGEGFWCNHYDGDPLLEDEIIKYLIPYIDKNYSTESDKRLIMGWSAGGMGAMILFSKHPALFRAALSLDGSIVSWEDFLNFQGNRPEIANSSAYYYDHCSPNEWMSRNRDMISEKPDTAIFLTAAFLAPYHKEFLSILKNDGIPFFYREIACNHEFDCVFSETSDDLLIFLSKSLK